MKFHCEETITDKFYSEDLHATITVIIDKGKQQRKMDLISKVLGLRSELFRKEANFMSRKMIKSRNLTFNLSEYKLHAFNTFLAWNATGQIESSNALTYIDVEGEKEEKLKKYQSLWDQLVDCYFLSQHIKAPDFGNAVIDALIYAIRDEKQARAKGVPEPEVDKSQNPHHTQSGWDSDSALFQGVPHEVSPSDYRQMLGSQAYQIRRICANTDTESPLRRLLVDYIVDQSLRKEYSEYYNLSLVVMQDDIPSEFRQQLFKEHAWMARSCIHYNLDYSDSQSDSAMSRTGAVCEWYHTHRQGVKQCKRIHYRSKESPGARLTW